MVWVCMIPGKVWEMSNSTAGATSAGPHQRKVDIAAGELRRFYCKVKLLCMDALFFNQAFQDAGNRGDILDFPVLDRPRGVSIM